MINPIKYYLKNFGPGLITASAAIGTSHFVQATRAGSYFGYELLWLIIAVNIFKYPFIEFGSRYVSATNNNLLVGYRNFNKFAFYILILLSLIASPLSIAAISFVCSGIIKEVLNINLDIKIINSFLLIFCILLISYGRYNLLDNIMKIFIIILTITTLFAVIIAFKNYQPANEIYYNNSAFDLKYIPFIIALMGWMPGPLDLSIWHSLWLEARNKTKTKLNFKQSQIDFNVGYLMTIITAILFLSIGALIIHNSNIVVPNKSSEFARLLINSYSSSIGVWASPIVGLAILAAMLSTLLAVVDIYPRVISQSFYVAQNKENIDIKAKRKSHTISMIISCLIALFIILFLLNSFQKMVDIVTIIAFLSGPFYAIINYKIVTSKDIDKKFHPKLWLKVLSLIGFLFLIGFVFLYIYSIAN